jgi:Fibronectin type III domain
MLVLLSGAYGVTSAVLPKTATSHSFTALHPGNDYWFFIYAKSVGGNASGTASTTTRTLSDTTPPSNAPVVSVTEVGANYAALSWTPPQDDGPYFFYEIFVNGGRYVRTDRNITSFVLRFLEPETTYNVTVQAYDEGNNRSPLSSPVTVTTMPPNPNDTTPPTTPANLYASGTGDGSAETHLSWTRSTDDFDQQSNIRYDVYVNGVRQDVLFGSGGPSIFYSEFGENVVEVFASDTAGNRSAPATVKLSF